MAQAVGYNIKPMQSLPAQALTGAVNGTAVDTQGADEVIVSVNVGTVAATGTLDVKVQESATSGGTFTDITGAVFTQFVPANDLATYKGRIKRTANRLRWYRVVGTQATAAAAGSADIILCRTQQRPTGTLIFNV